MGFHGAGGAPRMVMYRRGGQMARGSPRAVLLIGARSCRRPGVHPRIKSAGMLRRNMRYSITPMPMALMSFAHCTVSVAITAANSADVPPITSMPRSANCLRTSGCASTFMVSA